MQINGFSFSAVAAGIASSNRLDLALIHSAAPAAAAGVFTTNRVRAAPVQLSAARLEQGVCQAVLVNSGCANACTGDQGVADAIATSRLAAEALNIDETMVLVASTGVIGVPLEVDAFARAMGPLVAGLSPAASGRVAEAIMTTDTVAKTSTRSLPFGAGEATILGLAKGSGMIMPNMATMLAFILTDAAVSQAPLQAALTAGVGCTFNRITVDGDTSTNDMVLVLASGAAGNEPIDVVSHPDYARFAAGLQEVCRDLAWQIVADGEGASKSVTISVRGAQSDGAAERMARTVATSSLVKTAFFGEDANWGRIIAALGRAGVGFDPARVDIGFDDVVLVRGGLGQGPAVEAAATEVLRRDAFTVTIDLHDGTGGADIYTCDFSIDYVKINADYRS